MDVKTLPHEERPRQKLLRYGVQALSDSELLAVIIQTGTKDRPVMELAEELTNIDGNGLAGLGRVLPEELSRKAGIGQAKSCQIAAAVELGKRISKKQGGQGYIVRTPEDAANILMEDMRYLTHEVFQVILLNTKGKVIGVEKVAVGDLNSAGIVGREVFSAAVRKSAYAMILSHNHPSGDPTPSREDIAVTDRMKEAGRLLGIVVSDHIVIGSGTYYSFLEHNQI